MKKILFLITLLTVANVQAIEVKTIYDSTHPLQFINDVSVDNETYRADVKDIRVGTKVSKVTYCIEEVTSVLSNDNVTKENIAYTKPKSETVKKEVDCSLYEK